MRKEFHAFEKTWFGLFRCRKLEFRFKNSVHMCIVLAENFEKSRDFEDFLKTNMSSRANPVNLQNWIFFTMRNEWFQGHSSYLRKWRNERLSKEMEKKSFEWVFVFPTWYLPRHSFLRCEFGCALRARIWHEKRIRFRRAQNTLTDTGQRWKALQIVSFI